MLIEQKLNNKNQIRLGMINTKQAVIDYSSEFNNAINSIHACHSLLELREKVASIEKLLAENGKKNSYSFFGKRTDAAGVLNQTNASILGIVMEGLQDEESSEVHAEPSVSSLPGRSL